VLLEASIEHTTTFSTDTSRRKGYFAVTAMTFVDANMRILSVSMTCATSSHDSSCFQASDVGTLLDSGNLAPHWAVVADDAFKSRGHILSPFAGHSLTPDQRNFNFYVSKLRSVVERTFALWKGKWGIFWRPLAMARSEIRLVVETTARLHNFCIDRHCSTDPCDYCVHDDLFWTRTNSQAGRRVPPPPPHTAVQFPDEATIAAIFGQNEKACAQRWLRDEVIAWQRDQGYTAPQVSHRINNVHNTPRVSGLEGAQRDGNALLVESVLDAMTQ